MTCGRQACGDPCPSHPRRVGLRRRDSRPHTGRTAGDHAARTEAIVRRSCPCWRRDRGGEPVEQCTGVGGSNLPADHPQDVWRLMPVRRRSSARKGAVRVDHYVLRDPAVALVRPGLGTPYEAHVAERSRTGRSRRPGHQWRHLRHHASCQRCVGAAPPQEASRRHRPEHARRARARWRRAAQAAGVGGLHDRTSRCGREKDDAFVRQPGAWSVDRQHLSDFGAAIFVKSNKAIVTGWWCRCEADVNRSAGRRRERLRGPVLFG